MSHKLLAACIVLQLLTSAAHATTVELQQGLNGYTGAQDTYLDGYFKTTNSGTGQELKMESGDPLLLKFNIFNAEGGPVPDGATINTATLWLYKSSNYAGTFTANRLLKNWTEYEATWNQPSAGMTWTTAGASAQNADFLTTPDAQGTPAWEAGWFSGLVLTDAVRSLAGSANYGWRISNTGDINSKVFYSKEYTVNSVLRPKLVIDYTGTTPAATVPPNAPSGLTGTVTSATQINLNWSNNGGNALTFNLYRKLSTANTFGLPLTSLGASTTNYLDTGLAPATTYDYKVTASNSAGESTASNSVTATTMDPPLPPDYEGYHDTADCNTITGWAWDKNRANIAINIDIYSDTTLLSTILASAYRADLQQAGKGNGVHAFSYVTPASLKDGMAHTITVKYTDSSSNLGTTSQNLTCQSVSNTPPTINFTSPADNTSFTAPQSVNISVNASDSDGTVAMVELYQGATLLTTLTSPPYTYNWTASAGGNYTLFAKATDNLGATAQATPIHVNVTANAAPQVTLTAPTTGTGYTAPGSVILSAMATDSDGSISKVEFFQNNVLITTVTASPYTYTWSNVAGGAYTITAKATDNGGGTATSTPVTINVASGSASVYYIHTDQLNTPRLVTDQSGNPVWQWDNSDPFGANVPNQDPNNTGNAFDFNLRMPGQYADKETGLFYNYFRNYNPATGRYVESDPIGLQGGINTYGYVKSNPLSFIDLFGLAIKCKTILKLPFYDIQRCDEDGTTPSEQDAKDAKRMSDKELNKACKNNGYKDPHDFKRDMGLDSKSDIFADGKGNMYSGPRQGTGTPQYLHMNINGWIAP